MTRQREVRGGGGSPTRRRRAGMTLVEMLVATAVTLIMIAAISQAFFLIGQSVSESRATIEVATSLRAACTRLQQDLEGVTAPLRPWPEASSGLGYFEYLEGPLRDYRGSDIASAQAANDTELAHWLSVLGDTDDVLMFTAHSLAEPFVGRVTDAAGAVRMIESTTAEIIWWVRFEDLNGNDVWDPNEPGVLHRRVLLVRPDISVSALRGANDEDVFFQANDLSAHRSFNSGGTFVGMAANTLADLTLRHNRFAHQGRAVAADFPNPIRFDSTLNRPIIPRLVGDRLGEDVLLSGVAAFDLRAYDPRAPIRSHSGGAVQPGDPVWESANPGTVIGRGAFVDLLYHNATSTVSTFSAGPHARSQLSNRPAAGYSTYDTWSWEYERDGIDQDGDGVVDQGTDGLDNDGANGVDDHGERETAPPYAAPLRGLQVTIRLYDPDSRRVRQAAVVTDFTPE